MKLPGWDSSDGISVFLRIKRKIRSQSLCHVKRQPSTSQERGHIQEPNLLLPWCWTLELPELRNKYHICCLNHQSSMWQNANLWSRGFAWGLYLGTLPKKTQPFLDALLIFCLQNSLTCDLLYVLCLFMTLPINIFKLTFISPGSILFTVIAQIPKRVSDTKLSPGNYLLSWWLLTGKKTARQILYNLFNFSDKVIECIILLLLCTT